MKRKISPHLKMLGAFILASSFFTSSFGQSQIGGDLAGGSSGFHLQEACALSADGRTIVVGSQWTVNPDYKGRVRVFTLTSGVWTQRGSDIMGVANGDNWGAAVDISADGLTFIAGAPENDAAASNAGHVRVFTWNGSAWVQKGTAINGLTAGDLMGTAVSISGDGNSFLVGTHLANVVRVDDGMARIFRWNGSAWVQKGQTLVGETNGDQFGWSVDMSTNGNRVAIGAWSSEANNTLTNSGAVEVWEWNSGSSLWTQVGSDIESSKNGEEFGRSLGLSHSGDTLIVGAPRNSDSATRSGVVRIYEFASTSSWKQVGNTIAGEAAGDSSGHAVAISDNGRVIAIGAPRNDNVAIDAGQIRIYKNLGAGWVRAETEDIDGKIGGERNNNLQMFGRSVCLNRYGNNRLAGGSMYADRLRGVVRVYSTSPSYCLDGQVVWDGGGSTQMYTDRFNWVGDKCPCEGADVIFNTTNRTKDCIIRDTLKLASIVTAGYTGRIRLEGDTARIEVGGIVLQGAQLIVNPNTALGEIEVGNITVHDNSVLNLGRKGIRVVGTAIVAWGGRFNARAGSTINLNNLEVNDFGNFNAPQSNGIINQTGTLKRTSRGTITALGSIWNLSGSVSHDLGVGTATATTTTFNKLNISGAANFSNDNIVVTDTLRTIGSTANVSGGLFQAQGRVIIGSSNNTMTSLTFNAATGNQILSTATAGALTGSPVVVNKATSGNLLLGSDVNFGTLTLTKGHIDPNGFKATLTSNNISGASNASYIIGTAYVNKMNGAFSGNTVRVPIGAIGNYVPFDINNSGTKNDWKISVIPSDPNAVDPDMHSSLSSITTDGYFIAERLTADTFGSTFGIHTWFTSNRVAWLDGGSWRSIGGSTSGGRITSTEAGLFKNTGTYYITQGLFTPPPPAPINVVTEKDMVSGTEVSLEKSNASNQVAAANNSTALSVYPNPARTSIQVVLPSEAVSFHVSDMAGRVVGSYPASVRQIDLSNLNNGMYLITTEVNGTKQSIRFVKH